jgi:SAM-dependent methyltransferase
MLIVVKDDHSSAWEELARREPYFALLDDDGKLDVAGNANATAAFFDAGEEDVSALLAAIVSLRDRDVSPGRGVSLQRALDFGCGAGRLTLPLARRASQVVACDIAPTILEHARRNTEQAGLHNVTFISSEALTGAGPFDFICSLLVFEHIASAVGYNIIRMLVTLLEPGGVAALHVPLRRHADSLRRLVRLRSLPKNRTRGVIRQVQRQSLGAERSDYEERSVRRCIEAADARLLARLPIHHGQTGGVLIIEKR